MSRLNLLGAWNGGLEKFSAGNNAQSFLIDRNGGGRAGFPAERET
jgi:hypothetical protein